jgi:hypothetical protein
VTRLLGISTSERLIDQRDRNDHPVVRSRRPSCRPDLRAPTLSSAAAVQDARSASPKAARSVLDGCEHDGILIAETDDDANAPIAGGLHARIRTRRLAAYPRRR